MSENQKKVLVKLEVLELVLSIIGFITSCFVFVLTRIGERNFFYLLAVILGFNIIYCIRKIEQDTEKPKVIKYSKKAISAKNIKKVSY